ncbi:MAG: ABC transporter permease [Anaerolineae bacterium]|nr:ABC transporter permease [Anaerolineae bacterium]
MTGNKLDVAPGSVLPARTALNESGSRRALHGLLQARELRLFLVIVAAVLLLRLSTPTFLTSANLSALGIGMATDAIIAVAMTVLLVGGGFDLSVGSMLAFAGVIVALLLNQGMPIGLGILITLVVGALIGSINGFLVARVKVNPLITTLGMMTILSSATLVVSGGSAQTGLPKEFFFLGQGYILDIPVAIWIVLILVLVGDFLLRRARWLRLVYYVGNNKEAAALTGIKVNRVLIFTYILTAVAAAFAGIIATSRLSSAFPLAGKGTELRVIAACVIGGCSLSGGEGTIFGAFLGVVLMALINNALVLLNVSVYWQGIVSGLVLLAAVIFDIWSKRQQRA